LKIKDNAPISEDSEGFTQASFSFHGPNGNEIGEEFIIKFRVEKKFDEIQFYEIAMTIFEQLKIKFLENNEFTFEKVIEVLKKNQCNEEKAKEALLKEFAPVAEDENIM